MKFNINIINNDNYKYSESTDLRRNNRIVAVLPRSGGLPDPDSDADRHQNVIISWSLGHTPALHKISSKSVGNSIIQ